MITVDAGKLKLRVSVSGSLEKAETTFAALSRKVDDAQSFFRDYLAPEAYREIRLNFETRGGFVGGWRPLSPEYARRKRLRWGNRPIMVASGDLKASLTSSRDVNSVFAVQKRSMTISSRLRYLNAHQRGLGVPRRRVLFVPNRIVMRQLFKQWFIDQARDAGIKVRT